VKAAICLHIAGLKLFSMKRIVAALIAFVFFVCFFVSCKKGDTGPAGTANVSFSPWFKPDVYKKDTVFGIWGFKYDYAAPAITQNIIDSGTVLVFGKLLGYNGLIWPVGQVGQLPITLTYVSAGTTTDTWSALVTAGNLRIRFVNDKNTYNTISNAHLFRFVVIPGGVPVNGRMARLSYEEICNKYSIPL
jgi:hypothetical protein